MPTRRRLIVFAAFHFLERLALVATAFVFIRRGPMLALATSAALAVLVVARSALRASAWARVVATLHARVVDGLLARDLLRTSAFGQDDPETAAFEGLDAAARIAVDHRPILVADALAAACVGVAFLATQSLHALWLGVSAVAVTSLALLFSRARTSSESEHEWVAYRPVVERFVASLHARLEIVGNGATGSFRAAFAKELGVWQKASLRSQRMLGAMGRAPLLAGGAVVVGLFVLARSLQGGVTLDVISEAAIFGSALPPFAGLVRGIHEIRKLRTLATLIEPWLDAADPKARGERTSAPTKIAWRNFSFRYPGATKDALGKIELEIASQECVGIAGDNGSGKSTLLKSLLTAGASEEGEILVDAKALVRDEAWRRHVAYLPQRPYLGERSTVRDAFSLLASSNDDALHRHWLERLALWEVLARKSEKDPLSTRVGALSSGERQRLALARFFSIDRDLYLLDEPDANLDAAGVSAVASIVKELSKTKWIIVAAHTPELLNVATVVVRLDAGHTRAARVAV